MSIPFFDAFTCFGLYERMHAATPYTLPQLLDELRHCSISGAVVFNYQQRIYNAMYENRRLCDVLAPHRDWLFPMWNVMPHWCGDFPEPERLLELMRENGVRAVQVMPKACAWNLRSETSDELFRVLQRERVMTLLDVRDHVNMEDVEPLAARYPNLPLVMTGCTWGSLRWTVPLLRRYPNVHLTCDHFQVNNGLERLTALGCEEQLLFASRAPVMSAGAHRAYVDWAELPEATQAKIAGGNLRRLLGGQGPARVVENKDEDELMAATRRGERLACPVIDMHAHILDEGCDAGGAGYVMWDGGPRGVRKLSTRLGVEQIAVMSWNGTVGANAADGNRCVQAALDAEPGYYVGLASFDVVHQTPDELRAMLSKIFADRRFVGLKPYPNYGVPYSDPRFDPVWQFGHEHRLYVGVHPHNWYKADEFESMCSRFPNLTVVGYHAGSDYNVADVCIKLAQKFPNFMCEPTLTPVTGGVIDYLVQGCGVDRVMYGSDLPMRDPRQQLGWIVFSRLPVEQKKQVLGANARRLLDRVMKRG